MPVLPKHAANLQSLGVSGQQIDANKRLYYNSTGCLALQNSLYYYSYIMDITRDDP